MTRGTQLGHEPVPRDVALWGLHCYSPTARRTPHALVTEGENGRVLYEARAGASLRAVREAGLSCQDDQLDQLVEFGLLERRGDHIRTSFPLLGGDVVRHMREQVSALAARTITGLLPPVEEIAAELAANRLEGSAYAVVFGHALDGLLWDRLAAMGVLPETALTSQRPWWNGAFWAIYPPREQAAGTNFVRCSGATLTLVWTDSTLRSLTRLADAPGLRAAVAGLVRSGTHDHDGRVTARSGEVWQLRHPDGRPVLPILGRKDPLDGHADRLAEAAAHALTGPEATAARIAVPGDDKTAMVVVAHEFIWDVARRLTDLDACPMPLVLTDPAADAATLVDLLFVKVSPPR